MDSLKVAVIGGGISGPALALLLKQKLGVTAEVFEREHDIREVGAGIGMAPNGMRILAQLGLKEQLLAAGSKIRTIHLAHSDGSTIVRFPNNAEAQYGQPMLGFRRHRLRKVLLDRLAAEGIPLHLNKQLQGITQPLKKGCDVAAGPAVLSFKDGSTFEADLVVGCDGLRSATRQALFGPQALRHRAEEGIFAITDGGASVAALPDGEFHLEYGSGARYCILLRVAPDCFAWAAVRPVSEALHEQWGNVPTEQFAQEQAQVLSAFQHSPTVQAVASRPVAFMVRLGIYDRDLKPTWTKGTVTLAGDAACAMPPNLGQGGNKALEDVCCLAEALAHTFQGTSLTNGNTMPTSDHQQGVSGELYEQLAAALRLYEAVRLPRAAQVQARSRQAEALAKLQGALKQWVRDVALKAAVWWGGGSLPFGWLWGYDCKEEVAKAAAASKC